MWPQLRIYQQVWDRATATGSCSDGQPSPVRGRGGGSNGKSR